jgi:carboxyl-terminal processing protease
MKKQNPFQPLIYAMLLIAGIGLGVLVSAISADKNKPLFSGPYNKLNDILSFIRYKYVDSVSASKLSEDAINSLLSGLDPHSVYIPPTEIEEVNQSLEGNFDGIGIEFYIVKDTVVVVSPISGGPAEMLGMKAGDKILRINDTIVAGIGITNEMVMKKLRGPRGTRVKVGVQRAGLQALKEFNITRDKIPLYSVDVSLMLDDTTGYIKINRFSATTHSEFVNGLRKLNERSLKRLIVDLRQNPGGYLQAATDIADELISGKKILVYTEGNAYKRQDYIGQKPGMFERGDLVILLDQGSASASEILAGAVQDWDRGTIVGKNSFGKGLVQEQFELHDGSALRLTVARYYTPSGRCIQRPYSNGKEAYYMELANRMLGAGNNSDSLSAQDSLIYRTASGRIVYGGGGIFPDMEVKQDTGRGLELLYQARGMMQEFVYSRINDGRLSNISGTDAKTFDRSYQLPESLLQEFYAYANAQGFKPDDAWKESHRALMANYLKAYIARNRWQNEGYFLVLSREDEFIKSAMRAPMP